MAHFPITISETEFVLCPEPDLATYGHDCEDFAEEWAPVSVETAVTRGKRLRECKPSVQLHNECHVGIDFVKPCLENKRSHRKFYHHRPCYDIYNSPCIPQSPPCDCCPQTSSVRSKSCKRSKTSISHHKQCPLRIMELAAPTKRHCLDTWRSKSHILPDYMLDRVRRQVMDEKPLVEIPDALNCFKKRVSNRSSRSGKSRKSDACMSDIRRYSAIFAHCVARKLDKPLNITLNPELEKISKVISYEISNVTKKSNKRGSKSKKKNIFEKQMQDEMSKKVTAWIENVLVDTSDKLLEDDLRELEEQEGPVLDILDDLIDKVVTSCEPEEDLKYDTAGDTDDDAAPEQKSDTEETAPKDGDGDGDGDGNDLSIEDYLKNELYQQIDKITSNDEDRLNDAFDDFDAPAGGIGVNIGNIINDVANDFSNIATDVSNAIDTIDNVIDDIHTDIENLNPNHPNNTVSEYALEQLTDEEAIDQSGKNNNDENNAENDDLAGEINNVSELFKNSEGSLDENKTVKFSNVANASGGIEYSGSKRQKLFGLVDDEIDRPKTPSQQNIVLSAPNEHLLREVNEPWPGELRPEPPKLSATVSKSVISLGFIDEYDEKNEPESSSVRTTIPDTDKSGGDTTFDGDVQENINEIEISDNKLSILEAHDARKFTSGEIENLKTAIIEQASLKVTELSLSNIKGDRIKNAIESPILITQPEIIQSVLTFDGIKDEPILPQKNVDNYKVDIRTAPSWVVTGHCDKGRGEPEDILPEDKHNGESEPDEGDLRVWNKNLENICANLQIWNAWIEITCRNVKHIKRKSERNRSCPSNTYRQKDIDFWKKLERYINKDAVFWFKFKHSARRKLKTYKCIYRDNRKHDATIHSIKCNCKIDKKMQN